MEFEPTLARYLQDGKEVLVREIVLSATTCDASTRDRRQALVDRVELVVVGELRLDENCQRHRNGDEWSE
jgi:hypothetical protein